MASRIPKMPSMVSHVATAEETAADCSKAQAVMMPTPMAPAKKGIPKAPTSSASSSAPPASSRLQRVARITKRLPAAPAGGDVGRNCDDTAALQQPSTAIPCPPPSSSTAGPQQPVEEQPCGCSGDEGRPPPRRTPAPPPTCSAAPAALPAGTAPQALSAPAAAVASAAEQQQQQAVATDSAACSVSSASDSPAASSSAKRPTSLPSNQAEQEASTDSEDTEPPCCCPTTSTSTKPDTATATATTTAIATATATTSSTTSTSTTTSPSRVRRFFVASPNDPTPPSKFALSPAEARQMVDKLTEMYGNYNIRLIDSLLAAPPREICASVTAPASPRLSPTAESGEEEVSPAAPSEGTAQPSKAPKRKLSKFLRGLFGGCVGRNVEAL
ncbi:hypothetical protein PLESTM_001751200 [Pleodorina starrii]|nr:hypothetical protein PLESTM_001751200 [Pleodorina starrii]